MRNTENQQMMEPAKPLPKSIYLAIQFMMENFDEEIDLTEIAAAAEISKFNLCRNFQRRYNISPMKWLWTFRALLAAEFIKIAPNWSLTDIAFNCGYASSSHFSRSFSAVNGRSPSKFKKVFKFDTSEASTTPTNTFETMYGDNGEVVSAAFRRMGQFLARA